MPTFRVLKGVEHVYHRPDGTRVLVYPPTKNRRQRAFTKNRGQVIGLKKHVVHEVYPVQGQPRTTKWRFKAD
jgi:hypothetical protein